MFSFFCVCFIFVSRSEIEGLHETLRSVKSIRCCRVKSSQKPSLSEDYYENSYFIGMKKHNEIMSK